MKLIDQIHLEVVAGNGGAGKVSFFQDWQQPRPRPDGGNGGQGGNIILIADQNVNTFHFPVKKIVANSGQNGLSKNRHGKNGADLIFSVPLGTLLWTADKHFLLCDFTTHQQRFIVANGGKGGLGNAAFLSNTNRFPKTAQPGMLGENKAVFLELKMIAHVGLFGLPNVGKSSLLKALTAAQPRIANYTFTTLQPNLGVFANQIIISDLPGIIEGAHKNRGLGNRFLKHIERCVFLIYVVDLSIDYQLLKSSFNTLITELVTYNPAFQNVPTIVVGNKIDLPAAKNNLALFCTFLENQPHQFPFLAVSALKALALPKLRQTILQVYQTNIDRPTVLSQSLKQFPVKKLYEYKIHQELRLQKLRANSWLLSGKLINSLLANYDLQQPKDLQKFNYNLQNRGIDKIFRLQKIQNGDVIFIKGQSFTWKYGD